MIYAARIMDALDKYRKPREHRELESGFHYLMQDLREHRRQKPESRLRELKSTVEHQKSRYKKRHA
jgi:hypothetical protein